MADPIEPTGPSTENQSAAEGVAEAQQASAEATREMNINLGAGLVKELELLEIERQRLAIARDQIGLANNKLQAEQLLYKQMEQQVTAVANAKDLGVEELEVLASQIEALREINKEEAARLEKELGITAEGIKKGKVNKENIKSEKEMKDAVEKRRGLSADVVKSNKEGAGLTSKMAKNLGMSSKFSETMSGNLVLAFSQAVTGRGTDKIKGMVQNLANMADPMNIAASILDKMIKNAIELDKVAKAFGSATGMAGDFTNQINESFSATVRSGVSMRDTGQSLQALATGYSKFNPNAEAMNIALTKNVAMLSKLGVSAGQTTKILDMMTKGMGMSEKQAINMSRSLITAGRNIGISATKMASDIQGQLPVLERFGDRAIGVFKDLAAQAKATGMEMSSLVSVAQQFDTFDGAASKVAGMNAVLGTNLSALEMINMDYGERIRYMQQELQGIGANMDAMDPYTKQYLANAMGVKSVEEAQRLLNMNTKEYGKYQKELEQRNMTQKQLADATEKLVPMMEQLQLAFARIAANPMVVTIMKGLALAIGLVADNLELLLTAGAAYHVWSTISSAITLKNAQTKALESGVLVKNTAAWTANAAAQSAANRKAMIAVAVAGLLMAAFLVSGSPQFYLMPLVIAGSIFIMARALDTMTGAGMVAALALALLAGAMAAIFYGVSAVITAITGLIQLFIHNVSILPQVAAGIAMIALSVGALGIAIYASMAGIVFLLASMAALSGIFVIAGLIAAPSAMAAMGEAMSNIGTGMKNFAEGLGAVISLAGSVSEKVGEGFIAASVDGRKTSVVMGGSPGVLANFSSDRLVVDVNIPEITMPTPVVNIFLDGEQLRDMILEVQAEATGIK